MKHPLLFVLLLSAASTALAVDPENFTPALRDEVIYKALRGDGRASSDLSVYFGYKLADTEESRFWLKLSAEQGFCEGIVSMAGLMDTKDDREQVRKWIGIAEARHCDREGERLAHDIAMLRDKWETTKPQAPPPAPMHGPAPHDFSSAFDMDEKKLEATRQAAVRGDGEAAQRIYLYYMFGYDQIQEGWFWMHLAAEQGQCEAVVGYAGQLQGPMRRPEAAGRWVDRAEVLGCEKDARLKEDLDALRSVLRANNAIE